MYYAVAQTKSDGVTIRVESVKRQCRIFTKAIPLDLVKW